MAFCWERAVPLAFYVFFFLVLVLRVLFPFGVWDKMSNSIVSVPDHCFCIYVSSLFTSKYKTSYF